MEQPIQSAHVTTLRLLFSLHLCLSSLNADFDPDHKENSCRVTLLVILSPASCEHFSREFVRLFFAPPRSHHSLRAIFFVCVCLCAILVVVFRVYVLSTLIFAGRSSSNRELLNGQP